MSTAGLRMGLVLVLLVCVSMTAYAARCYLNFLQDVANLKGLALRPQPGVTCREFTSYDRRSRLDKDGNQVDWGANGDAGNFLRQEPEGHVLAEMEGPGAIVRIWSANPSGTLKVFIDGAPQPTLQADFAQLVQGKVPGIPEPIVGMHALGANCYLPMPYQTRCRVVVENPGSLYYSVSYRTYPAGTRLQPFHWPLAAKEQQEVERLAAALAHPDRARHIEPGTAIIGGQAVLYPGQSAYLAQIKGARAVTALKLKADLPADTKAARLALRGLLLVGTFDRASKPQIWTPLGDFFGTGPGANLFRGVPTGCTEEGYYSYWYMPFAEEAELQVRNDGEQPVQFSWELEHVPLGRAFSDLMHFHARWRRDHPNQTFDWPFLEATGRGRFVGVAMSVWNPTRGWWGEGDEKVRVDGERFPSWFGTGSEDYFGYAWCCTQLFSHAFHAQPLCEGPGNANYTSVNRWHVADNIPFQQHFRMTIENYGQDKDYSCVAYWYATPETTDFFQPASISSRLAYHEPLPTFRIPGAIEGEAMQIVGRQFEGAVDPQLMGGFGGQWSDETQLWLRPTGPGQWVDLALPVPESGEYEMVVYLTRAGDYGQVQLALNGQPVGGVIDCFNNGVVPTGPLSLGRHRLQQGNATLRLEVVGKHQQSTGYMAGLDCVVLRH